MSTSSREILLSNFSELRRSKMVQLYGVQLARHKYFRKKPKVQRLISDVEMWFCFVD